jgi:hypothetical protein
MRHKLTYCVQQNKIIIKLLPRPSEAAYLKGFRRVLDQCVGRNRREAVSPLFVAVHDRIDESWCPFISPFTGEPRLQCGHAREPELHR